MPSTKRRMLTKIRSGWGLRIPSESERNYRGPDPTDFSWPPRTMSVAFASPRLLLTPVLEQTLVNARIITDPMLGLYGRLGVDVCVRSSVEMFSKALWLTSPRISPHERLVGTSSSSCKVHMPPRFWQKLWGGRLRSMSLDSPPPRVISRRGAVSWV